MGYNQVGGQLLALISIFKMANFIVLYLYLLGSQTQD